ncbi:hypothetical protein JRQ81_002899 [Phrynocephalus forsythii]|uniref:Uncharacterized protein n=1 Tax=Phrynocephalus forsythii TaxID=171643 RepID=A0A9Q0XM26_9SAUR|nr:hypothetical protein JRQ81_002899 [Phrynocephalus forsythii]
MLRQSLPRDWETAGASLPFASGWETPHLETVNVNVASGVKTKPVMLEIRQVDIETEKKLNPFASVVSNKSLLENQTPSSNQSANDAPIREEENNEPTHKEICLELQPNTFQNMFVVEAEKQCEEKEGAIDPLITEASFPTDLLKSALRCQCNREPEGATQRCLRRTQMRLEHH